MRAARLGTGKGTEQCETSLLAFGGKGQRQTMCDDTGAVEDRGWLCVGHMPKYEAGLSSSFPGGGEGWLEEQIHSC